MAADPKQVIRIIGHRGIAIRLVDGQLEARWRHGDRLPADMAEFIRHYKALIVAELAEDKERDVAA